MVQHARANDKVETLAQVADVLDWQLPRFEIRQVVLLLVRFRVLETSRADVDGSHVRRGMAKCVLCGLPRSTSSVQNIEIGAIRFVRPHQMVLGMMDVLVLPKITSTIEILNRRREGMTRVKLIDWISVSYLHCDCLSCIEIGARIIHAPTHIATNAC